MKAGIEKNIPQKTVTANYNPYKIIKSCIENGHYQKAYELAKKNGDNYIADKLASKYNIPGHEFSDFPPVASRDIIESMNIALKSRLQPGATAERLGFTGFKNRVVADIGARDGRFIPLFRELGASEIYAIDPDWEALQKAIDNKIIDKQHVLPYKLQNLPNETDITFEIATIFNFNMPYIEQADFFKQLYNYLPKNGQAIMTVAEDKILQDINKFIKPLFEIQSQRLWDKNTDYPHKNLAVLTKKKHSN